MYAINRIKQWIFNAMFDRLTPRKKGIIMNHMVGSILTVFETRTFYLFYLKIA